MSRSGSTRLGALTVGALALLLVAIAGGQSASAADGVKAQYKSNDTAASDNQIKPGLQIVNTGTTPLDLSTAKVRYYFTRDNAAALIYACDWAALGCTNVRGTFGTVAPATTTADSYLELSLTGSLAPGASTGEIQSRINHGDWSTFTETNDYSRGTLTTFSDSSTVTVTVAGAPAWGVPPGGATTPTPTPTPSPTSSPTPTPSGNPTPTPSTPAPRSFVSTSGSQFALDGKPFRYGGTNQYYLHYKSHASVDDVLADAKAMDLTVIRAWGHIDRGSLTGGVPNVDGPGEKDGVYFQYWDAANNVPAYNDGASGLEHLDYLLAQANARGIKVILTLTNNWKDFGGMDQYVTWYGLQYHDQFYTDARVRQAYKNWAAHLVNRVNTVTGVTYRDDPAIFSWELANEPRCINANKPTSGTCTATTLTSWANEMSTYIKSIDGNHMISVGDEGFLRWGVGASWPYNGADGVDHEALTKLPHIAFGTYHLYPDHWGQTAEWGTQWITDHQLAAASIGKPTVLEEFGFQNKATRDSVYREWTQTVRTGGGAGWNFWLLSGTLETGQLYPDYDGFTVYYPSATATLLATEAAAIAAAVGPAPTPTPTPTATATPTPTPTATPTPTPTPRTGAVTVRYRSNDTNATDNQIKPGLQVVNTGNSAVALSSVTARYYFTRDGGPTTFNAWCDWAQVSCSTISLRVVNLTTPVAGADAYLEVGFTGGTLAAGAGTGDVQVRVNKSDWSAFNEVGDYSRGTDTAYTDATRVPAYVGGTLAWGTTPD